MSTVKHKKFLTEVTFSYFGEDRQRPVRIYENEVGNPNATILRDSLLV